MKKTSYTQEQIDILLLNPYVQSCTTKYVTLTDACKISALKLDAEWWYFQDIFAYLGFPDFFLQSGSPKQTMKNWRHALRTKGFGNMIGQIKGRKPKEMTNISEMTKDEYIVYLETKTAYLEALAKRIQQHDP